MVKSVKCSHGSLIWSQLEMSVTAGRLSRAHPVAHGSTSQQPEKGGEIQIHPLELELWCCRGDQKCRTRSCGLTPTLPGRKAPCSDSTGTCCLTRAINSYRTAELNGFSSLLTQIHYPKGSLNTLPSGQMLHIINTMCKSCQGPTRFQSSVLVVCENHC